MALNPQATAVLQLLADVLVSHGYADGVVAIALGLDAEGQHSTAFAKAPAGLTMQLGVGPGSEGEPVVTAVIGQTGPASLIDALEAVLRSYAPPDTPG